MFIHGISADMPVMNPLGKWSCQSRTSRDAGQSGWLFLPAVCPVHSYLIGHLIIENIYVYIISSPGEVPFLIQWGFSLWMRQPQLWDLSTLLYTQTYLDNTHMREYESVSWIQLSSPRSLSCRVQKIIFGIVSMILQSLLIDSISLSKLNIILHSPWQCDTNSFTIQC